MMIPNRGTIGIVDPVDPSTGLEVRSRLTQPMKNRGEENLFEVIFDFGLLLKSADDSTKSFLFPKPAEHKSGAPFLGPAAEGLIFPMSRENGKLFGELGKVLDKSVELAGLEEMVVATKIGDGALFDLSFVPVAFDNAEVETVALQTIRLRDLPSIKC
jgi:hypothetical protein